MKVKSLSHVWLFATPWTVAYQAPQSMDCSKQEYWTGLPLPGLPLPSPGDLPDPGIEPGSSALQADALPSEPPGKPLLILSPLITPSVIFSFHLFKVRNQDTCGALWRKNPSQCIPLFLVFCNHLESHSIFKWVFLKDFHQTFKNKSMFILDAIISHWFRCCCLVAKSCPTLLQPHWL